MSTQTKKESSSNAACGTQETSQNTFKGKVVSLTGDKLVMRNEEGKECCHTLAQDAKVTCDGEVCQPDALKVGSIIRVTTKNDDQNVATCVEGLNRNTEFAQCS